MCADNIPTNSSRHLSNGAIAAELMALAQFLAASGANKFKVKAYRRAARTIRGLGESIDELVRNDVDLTQFPGIGGAISGAIQEIVRTGTLRHHPLASDRGTYRNCSASTSRSASCAADLQEAWYFLNYST